MADEQNERQGSIFVTKGAQLTVPVGGLTIRVTDEGEVQADPIVLHITLDTCPYWLEIAIDHATRAGERNQQLLRSIRRSDDAAIGDALQVEFLSGMQAVVASAVAVDALYGAVKERIDLPPDLVETWRRNRTARHSQIFEVFRRAVHVDQSNAPAVKGIIKDLMRFRGLAVHPSNTAQAAAYHPDLGQGTEWRFVAFGYHNSKKAVRVALAATYYIAGRRARSSDRLQKYLDSLVDRIRPLRESWEDAHGSVFKEYGDQGRESSGD